MKNFKENAYHVLLCVIEIVIGALLLIEPVRFTSTILLLGGILSIVLGVLSVIRYFQTDAITAAKGQLLLKGLALLSLGYLLAFEHQWIMAAFPVITVLYGVFLFADGLFKVQWTVDTLRLKKGKWFLPAIGAAASVICAIVIVKNPFSSTAVLWIFIGAALIAEAVVDILSLFLIGAEADTGKNGTETETDEMK